MFHSLLYLIVSIASVAHGQTTFSSHAVSRQNKLARNRASCASLSATACNGLINVVLFAVFGVLLRGPSPPPAYVVSTLVSSAVLFELFWFVGCTANQRHAWLEDAGWHHSSYNRWTVFKGNFENACSLLDMHPCQNICTNVLPYFATAVVCQGGYWVNLLLTFQMCFRQYVYYESLKTKYTAGSNTRARRR